MRVTGSARGGLRPPDIAGARTGAVPSFHLAAPSRTVPATPASAPLAAPALFALQTVEEPAADRRRRAVRRGLLQLDLLDELRLALFGDAVPLAVLQRLRAALQRSAGFTGDATLSGLLVAIDVRCAVELAKLEAAGSIG